jgi:hypothetical protein
MAAGTEGGRGGAVYATGVGPEDLSLVFGILIVEQGLRVLSFLGKETRVMTGVKDDLGWVGRDACVEVC